MKKILLLQLVLMLALHGMADPEFSLRQVPDNRGGNNAGKAALRSNSNNFKNAAGTDPAPGSDMATTIKARGLYTDGEVTLDVTKANDGSIELYDAKRKIYTKNCATLASFDELNSKGKLFDYIKPVDPSTTESEVMEDMLSMTRQIDLDITNYIHSAQNVRAADGQLYAYRLKNVTIEKMTQNGKDFMPTSGGQPLGGLILKMTYIDRPWVQLFMEAAQEVSTSPIKLESNPFTQRPISDSWAIIPREGVTFQIIASKDELNSLEDIEGDAASFTVNMIPDAAATDGATLTKTIEQDGLKMTVSYERTGSHMADIHWGMARTYDFYKNMLGRDSYDGKGAPIYNLSYLPGGYVSWDESFPIFFTLMFTQANAEAFSRYNPYVMLYGTGGYVFINQTSTRPAVELSIMCHEFTHLVTKCTAQLPSNLSEGQGLNESFSDIMSVSMMATSEYGYGPNTPWVVGGKGFVVGSDYLRNLGNPQAVGYPDTYDCDPWNSTNIYNMSAVQSYFYYLLCKGGKGKNGNGLSYDITGIGVEKGMKIAYLTLTKYCTPESDYSNIRDSWLKAAQELYGANGTEAQTVAKAWTAVGIDGTEPSGIHEIVNGTSENSESYYTIDGCRLNGKPSKKGAYIHRGRVVIIK